jgi:hypothetical protein
VRARIEGATEVARHTVGQVSRYARWCRPALVNGGAGYVVLAPHRRIGVVGLTVTNGRITSLDLIIDPAKIRIDQAAKCSDEKFS